MSPKAALRYGLTLALALCGRVAHAQDFKREVIYQIVTDRFMNGDTANDDPSVSPGLFDPTRSNWHLYWGGDLQGIGQKLSYLKGLGVTALWISPPVDNINEGILDGAGQPTAPYHGYWARDFKRIEEHFGDAANSWKPYDDLVAAAHALGMKVIVDFAPNHTSPGNAGEMGALFDEGVFMTDYPGDTQRRFHRNPGVGNWDDRYQLQYFQLFGLADLDQTQPQIDAYLKDAARLFVQHGTDAFRIDASKHVTWGWQPSLVSSIFSAGRSFVFGEWYQGGTTDALYRDSVKLANQSGLSLLDFPLNTALRNVFGRDHGFAELDAVMTRENADFVGKDDLITFVDNHDMSRFLTLHNDPGRLHQALVFLLTGRGIPCVLYGTEQYLHVDEGGGGDPFNRAMMSSWRTDTLAYKVVGELSALRRTNGAVPYGSWRQRWIDADVYVYERRFFEDVVLVAINKSASRSYNLTGLFTALPAGTYADVLAGWMGGPTLSVSSGSPGENPVMPFSLGPGKAAVWARSSSSTTPQVGSLGPTRGPSGLQVTVAGEGFGATPGRVLFGTTEAALASWSDLEATFVVPSLPGGTYDVSVRQAGGAVSNPIRFTLSGGLQVPVTFTVRNAIPTQWGDNIFLVGNTLELGRWNPTWDDAVGPMLAPSYPDWFITTSVAAGQTVEFKFVRIGVNGGVTWENGANHTYTAPLTGPGHVEVSWQY